MPSTRFGKRRLMSLARPCLDTFSAAWWWWTDDCNPGGVFVQVLVVCSRQRLGVLTIIPRTAAYDTSSLCGWMWWRCCSAWSIFVVTPYILARCRLGLTAKQTGYDQCRFAGKTSKFQDLPEVVAASRNGSAHFAIHPLWIRRTSRLTAGGSVADRKIQTAQKAESDAYNVPGIHYCGVTAY